MKPIRLVEILITAYEKENFFLVTDLTDDEIKSSITPMIMRERNDPNFFYDNSMLVDCIKEQHKDAFVQYYQDDSIDFIRI